MRQRSSGRRRRARARLLILVLFAATAAAVAAFAWLSFGDGGAGASLKQITAVALRSSSPAPSASATATPAYPRASAIARALAWARKRGGDVGVAIVDSHGVLHGYNAHTQFQSASLAKAMLLVAYLRRHPSPSASRRATLAAMIEESDNDCADIIYAEVGDGGLRSVARLAGMTDFDTGTSWIDTEMTAADQARFFYRYESYLPARSVAFARRLLSGIVARQRWGIPAAAGPAGWKVFFKAGWLGWENETMDQAAWLEKDGVRWSLAILTDDNETSSSGWETQKGITGLLLGHEPTAAYLAVVHEGDAK